MPMEFARSARTGSTARSRCADIVAFDRHPVVLRTFWPSDSAKLTIAHMAQDVSLAGLPDDYTEFSSDSDTLDVRGWAHDGDDGGAGEGIEIVDDAYFDGAFDDAMDEPPAV